MHTFSFSQIRISLRFTGVVGLLWVLIWFAVVKDRPKDDPYISNEELRYIQDTLGNISDEKVTKN